VVFKEVCISLECSCKTKRLYECGRVAVKIRPH
jgi:hypothetical protein